MKNQYRRVCDHGSTYTYIFQFVVIVGMLQCFLVHGFTTTTTTKTTPYQTFPFSSSLFKEGYEMKLYAGNARENEIRKKVGADTLV